METDVPRFPSPRLRRVIYMQRFELLGVMSPKLVTISGLYIVIAKSSRKLKLREVMKDIGRAANLGYHLTNSEMH